MTFNLFNKFILWLKKIFNIFLKLKYEKKEPVESKPPEENTSEVPLKKIEIEPQI